MSENGILFAITVLVTVFAAISIIGGLCCPAAARYAVRTEDSRPLRLSCMAAQFKSWTIALAVLEWILVVIAITGVLDSAFTNMVASGVLLAGAVTLVIDKVKGFHDAYWSFLRDVLDSALPKEGPQRQTFHEHHAFLREGSSTERNAILAKILRLNGPRRILVDGKPVNPPDHADPPTAPHGPVAQPESTKKE